MSKVTSISGKVVDGNAIELQVNTVDRVITNSIFGAINTRFLDGAFPNLPAPNLNDDELLVIKQFVEADERLRVVNGLFRIFQFNLESMLKYYSVLFSGSIARKDSKVDPDVSDEIAINAFTTNFVSSGRFLLREMEEYLRYGVYGTLNGESAGRLAYSNCVKPIEDKSFSFRLLDKLRNLMQHGEAVVRINPYDRNRCFYDFLHILYLVERKPRSIQDRHKPYHNIGSIKSEIESYIERGAMGIQEGLQGVSYTATTQAYHLAVLQMYANFLDTITGFVENVIANKNALLYSRPDIVCDEHSDTPGFVVYEIDGRGIVHMFDSTYDALAMLASYKEYLKKELERQQNTYDEVWNDSVQQKGDIKQGTVRIPNRAERRAALHNK